MKVRVLGFLEIRGILRFLKNNKDSLVFIGCKTVLFFMLHSVALTLLLLLLVGIKEMNKLFLINFSKEL